MRTTTTIIALTLSIAAGIAVAGVLDPDCTAEKAAKSAAMKATVVGGGRCSLKEAAADTARRATGVEGKGPIEERREVYATTGSRMRVRFFGGWDIEPGDALRRVLAPLGYTKGVPMGADLPAAADGAKAPTFMVYALRDPVGANLDRIQIIKGWLDADGNP
jgi:hypothetical protein